MLEFMGIEIKEDEVGDLTEHFDRKEFECRCGCGLDRIDINLVFLLERVRGYFNKPVIINSANRCEEHNKNIGGAERSRHLISQAADIVVKGIDPGEVYKYLHSKYPLELGLGNYKTFTHVDVRATKARW